MEPKRSRKPAKKLPTAAQEARHTSVLLEAIHKEVRVIAEGQTGLRTELMRELNDFRSDVKRDMDVLSKGLVSVGNNIHTLRSEFDTSKNALFDVDKTVQRLEPLVNTLTDDVKTLKADVKTLQTDVSEIKTDVKEIKERLLSTEAKLAV